MEEIQRPTVTEGEQLAQVEEQEVEECCWQELDKLQDHGIGASDIAKLKAAGYNTVASIAMACKKDLTSVKGLAEAKVDKAIEAAHKSCSCPPGVLFYGNLL
eukprot:gene3391-645_t